MKKLNNLYILGNGFDLYHQLKTKFSDFKDYIEETDSELFRCIEEYLPVDEEWAYIEEFLSKIDIDLIIDNASIFLASYGAGDWKDSMHHAYSYEVEDIVELLSTKLVEKLREWISTIKIKDLKKNESLSSYIFIKSSFFFTFNYTCTLEYLYNISSENILHIHGTKNSPILGHNYEDIPSFFENEDTG